MNHLLTQFSDQLSAAVEEASRFVVSVSGHPRNPASGVHWKQGIVVTVAQALRQQTKLELVVDGGAMRNASLVAADAATGLAVLRLEDGPELGVATTAENAAAVQPGQLALAVGRSRHSGVNGAMGDREHGEAGVPDVAGRTDRSDPDAGSGAVSERKRRRDRRWRGASVGGGGGGTPSGSVRVKSHSYSVPGWRLRMLPAKPSGTV